MNSESTVHIPLSLRRKVVIALDLPQLIPAATASAATEQQTEEANHRRLLTLKCLGWCQANLLRPQKDHIFLVTFLDPADTQGTLGSMWGSMMGQEDNHMDQWKEAQEGLKELSEKLSQLEVSVSTEVLRGGYQKVAEYVHQHKGEVLVVQTPKPNAGWTYSWAERCARESDCPTVMVEGEKLADGLVNCI